MSKKDDFKYFISKKPELVQFVENGQMTWQKFYEIYDLYGDKSDVWDKYQIRNSSNGFGVAKINDLIKNVDINSIKEHIDTAQKALDFVQELTSKASSGTKNIPVTPRPLNKFFGD